MARQAALFDLDRTLVRVNTAALYMAWQFRQGLATPRDMARVAWWLVQYTLGVVDAEHIAHVAAIPMRGRSEASLRSLLREWVHAEVMPHVADAARTEIARRKAAGYLCAILTSSTPYSAEPLAEALGIEHVLASRLVVVDGAFTGDYIKPLCYGPGKVHAAEAWARALDVDLGSSAFYTDSISDLPMLERVGEPIVVNPDPRLRWRAWRRGWRSERW